jgi:hypothetical protein
VTFDARRSTTAVVAEGGGQMDEQQIELIDYVQVMWRQKWIIIAGTCVALLSVVALTMGREEPSAASTILDLGVPGEKEGAQLERFVANFERKLKAEGDSTIKSPKDGLIELTAIGASPAAARTELDALVESAQTELTRVVDQERKRLATLEQRRRDLHVYLGQLETIQLQTTNHDTPAGLVLGASLASQLSAMRSELADLDGDLAFEPNPSISRGLTQVRRASGYSRRLLLMVTLVGALIAFTCLAFLVDYWQAVEARRRALKTP